MAQAVVYLVHTGNPPVKTHGGFADFPVQAVKKHRAGGCAAGSAGGVIHAVSRAVGGAEVKRIVALGAVGAVFLNLAAKAVISPVGR